MNMIGHQKTQATLAEMLASGRFPHALILHGQQGIGKRKLAEVLARVLLCGGGLVGGKLTPTPNHPLLPQIEAGACADYMVLEKGFTKEKENKTIKIEQAREVLSQLSMAADGNRVMIVDAADELGEEAANVLLKTLEEPGKNIYFIVLAHNLFRVLPTILSRCRKLKVEELSASETKDILAATLPDATPSEVELLAAHAAGSPGQALLLGREGAQAANLLLKALHGDANPVAVGDKLGKDAGLALDILLRQLALRVRKMPHLSTAETYAQLESLRGKMESHNLTGAWVVEHALRSLQPLWQNPR
ncbi:MAG: hypothetical protein WAX89_06685 [Alphaproteobacteria bacterium]